MKEEMMDVKGLHCVIPGFKLLSLYGKKAGCGIFFAYDMHNVPRMIRIVLKNRKETSCAEEQNIIFYRLFSEDCSHLLHLLYAGETQECFYYVSQSIDNVWNHQNVIPDHFKADTLLHRLQKHNLSRLEIIGYILDILNGLEHLHDHGMAHNFLIPENIVFVHNKLQLSDPLLSRVQYGEDKSRTGWTSSNTEPDMDEKQSDIYALGRIICCLINRSVTPEIRPEEIRKDLRSFKKIVMSCCSTDPGKRYRNCRQIRQDVLKMVRRRSSPRTRIFYFLLILFSVQSILLGLSLSCTITSCKQNIRIRQWSQTLIPSEGGPGVRKNKKVSTVSFAILPSSAPGRYHPGKEGFLSRPKVQNADLSDTRTEIFRKQRQGLTETDGFHGFARQ